VRQAKVQSLFLSRFDELFPRLRFRAIRRFPDRSLPPYAFALRVAVGRAALELDLLCVVLTEGHPEEVRRFARAVAETAPLQMGHEAVPTLVAPFFSPESQALCREAGVAYLDLAGNAGLDTAHCHIELGGRQNTLPRKHEVRSPFSGRAERVVRRLMLEPERTWSMRALAQAASVSLGLASMTTTALAEMEVVRKGRSGVELLDPSALLDAWAEVYDLRSNAFVAYRSWQDARQFEQELIRHREALDGRYALTLWSAAHYLLGGDEAPAQVALYWRGDLALLARALILSPDVGRTYVFCFQPYDESLLWARRETPEGLGVVSPLQLYLDLNSGDEREVALAQRVRGRLLPW
jgi:hypothetical protein